MNNPELAPEGVEAAAEALRKMYHGGDPDEPFHLMAKCAITAYLGSTGAVAPEPWRCAKCDCHSYARVDQLRDDATGYEPGPKVRCVNCKDVSFYPAPADTGQGGRETVTVHHHPDNKPSPALDAIVSAAVQQFTAEPPWTMRLANVEQRTAIEQQASDLKGAIEALGGHPLLTDALRATDLAMRTLGKWHDAGEPGAALDAGARA